MFDFHLHLARLPQPEQLAKALLERGYHFIAIACEPWEWEILEKIPLNDKCGKAFGIHPMIATQVSEQDWDKLRELLVKNPDAGVGECGIDKRYEGYMTSEKVAGQSAFRSEISTQEQVFKRQVELARELRRDLQIHCVGDYARLIKMLKECRFPEPGTQARSIFHRFGGDVSIVRAAQALSPIFSLHKDSFRKKSTAAAIAEIPAEQVRFETDADECFLNEEGRCPIKSGMTVTGIVDELITLLQTVKARYDSNS